MYSVVLMMALSGGAEAPEFGGRGCNGCAGGLFSRGCQGGGCHGRVACQGRAACHGGGLLARGCQGCRGGLLGGRGCHGTCRGTVSCQGAAPACTGGGTKAPATKEPKKMPPDKKVDAASPATIVVTLPADAKLTIDGNATKATSARRVFVSPNLDPGAEYAHELTAELVIDGRTVSQTQRISVRAGQVAEVPFTFSTEGVASR